MDIPVVATALESHKRPRDAGGSYNSDELADQTSAVKRICGPFIEDVSISSILEKVSEPSGLLYEVNELDEAQEKLVCGVMRSLEEEISVSDHPASSCILFPEGQAVDSTSLPTFSQETSLAEDFSLRTVDETTSTSCSEELENFELPSILESICSLNERSSTFMEISALVSGSIHGTVEDGPVIVQSEKHNRFDIGYLLEASDDELGIAPSPSSRSFSSETDVISGSLLATDSTSSNNDPVDFEPWQYEWDCSSESFYELAHDEYTTDQEWLRSAISPLEMVGNHSVRAHTALDTSSTYEEPAGVRDY